MPESQFGQALTSLDATLDELVALARHMRATPASVPSRLLRLEGLAKMLAYFTQHPQSVEPLAASPLLPTVACAFDGCTATSSTPDACLINFASRDSTALWLCRDHHPPLTEGSVRPPGWQPPQATLDAAEAARKTAMAKITRDELVLVNGRMRGA